MKSYFSRKQQKEHWRLACQTKVKEDMQVKVPEEVLGVKEWECEVISNKNVATFIKEFIVQLPKGEHMDFIPGSYAQIKIPAYSMDYDKDIDKSLIGEEYLRHADLADSPACSDFEKAVYQRIVSSTADSTDYISSLKTLSSMLHKHYNCPGRHYHR